MGLKQKRQLKTLSTNVLVPRKTQLDNKTKRYFQLSTVAVGITGLTLITPILQPVSLALLAYLCLPIFKSTWVQWHKKNRA